VRRIPRPAGWAIAGVALAFAAAAYLEKPNLADHLPPIRLAEFFLGVVAGRAFRNGWRPQIHGAAVLAVMVASLAVSSAVIPPLRNAIMAGPFLVLILHAAGRDLKGAPGWLASPALVFAGEASYAFYLVHELVIVNLARAVPPGLPSVALITVLAAVGAVALHMLIERPCNRLLRDRSPSLALAPVKNEQAQGSDRICPK
jgi:peptidoglycan/LPS O-acetylase OafA/YrhL